MDEKKTIVPLLTTSDTIDDYSDFELSPAGKKYLFRALFNMKEGLVSISPLICRGKNCIFISRCPIYLADGKEALFPEKKQCIVELNFIREKYLSYLEEIQEDEETVTLTQKSLLSKLVELDLQDYRASLILSGATGDNGNLLLEQVIGISPEGDPLTQLQDNPVLRIKEKIHRQRMEILDSLILSPSKKIWKRNILKREELSENYISHNRKVQQMLEDVLSSLEKNES